jgi:type VII secretion protein EccB
VATRKDQLDAFNFARRRLVANLVAPSATGSDEGAPRPIRTFASSIILSAIAVAAVAVLGVFKPAAPSGWQGGYAVDSSSGAGYIDQSNVLHSVDNITSARLLLGSKFTKYNVPDSTLNNSGIPIGPQVGILGAPEDVPSASNMNLTQWSFCQNEASAANEAAPGGLTHLEIGYWPTASSTKSGLGTASSAQAMIVHDSVGKVYLIHGDYRYYVGNESTDPKDVHNLLEGVAGDDTTFIGPDMDGYWVSDTWLSVFPLGSPIDYPTLTVDDLGAKPAGLNQLGDVGQYGQVGSGGVVQTANGVVQLNMFAYDLYKANPALNADNILPLQADELTTSAIGAAQLGSSGTPADVGNSFTGGSYGSNWPTQVLAVSGADTGDSAAQNICVGYQYTNSASVQNLTIWLSSQLPYGASDSQLGLTQKVSTAYANTVLVKPGYGLIAQSSSGGAAQNSPYLIEDSDYRYALMSDASGKCGDQATLTAVCQLGYGDVTVQPVLAGFLDLIQVGPNLDPKLAGLTSNTASIG